VKLSQILSQVKTDFSLPKGALIDSITIEDIAIDSRLVKKNSVFFALPGKINDGSKFIASALANGAAIVIAENDENSIKSSNPFQLLVEFLQE
jgi:UDP-N-acetylmuramyl pentapeptide synthase